MASYSIKDHIFAPYRGGLLTVMLAAISISALVILVACAIISLSSKPKHDKPREITGIEQARQMFHDFLSADSPESKAVFVSGGNSLIPSMRNYYNRADTDRMLQQGSLESDYEFPATQAIYGLDRTWSNIKLSNPLYQGESAVLAYTYTDKSHDKSMPVFFHARKDGAPLLDWEAYIQEKDSVLNTFCSSPGQQVKLFRLLMRRVQLTDAPDCDSQVLGLTLRDLSGRQAGPRAIVRPQDAAYTKLAKNVTWGRDYIATVSLAWRFTGDGRTPEIKIDDFINWGFAEAPTPDRQTTSTNNYLGK